MKFSVNLVTKGSGRIGLLTGNGKRPRFRLETPGLALTTKSASIPYVSKEVLDLTMPATEQEQQLLSISLQSTIEMTESLTDFKRGISEFVALGQMPAIVSVNDVTVDTKGHHNENNGMAVFPKSGKKVLNVDKYMATIEPYRADMVVLLGDTNLDMECGKNRSRRSVNRTKEFVDKCLEIAAAKDSGQDSPFLVVPVIGGAKEYDRNEHLEYVGGLSGVSGYSIEGLHRYGTDPLAVDQSALLDCVKICLQKLPSEKMRMMLGAYSPMTTLDLIASGVDLFDNSLAYLYSEAKRALIFNVDPTNSSRNTTGLHIPIMADENKDNFKPILEGCTCLACSQHTLAYIRHLFDAKELLGSILLMIHNNHHYQLFFKAIRKHAESDTLPELRSLIAAQSEDEDYSGLDGVLNKSDGMVIDKKPMND